MNKINKIKSKRTELTSESMNLYYDIMSVIEHFHIIIAMDCVASGKKIIFLVGGKVSFNISNVRLWNLLDGKI